MDLPIVDLAPYLAAAAAAGAPAGEEIAAICAVVSRSLRETGVLVVKDPRCPAEDNDRFIDMLERYFEQSDSAKRLQERPHLRYQVVAEMAAIGFGLPKDAFTSIMKQGPHLLAPTGSDLQRHGIEGTVFAGYHYDLNFLTIHGRCRFPGLNIWLSNGPKVEVKVPLGCLLIQSGKQLEWLTGGDCLAGMHEVVVSKRTLDAIELARQKNQSLWRVSSTLFSHIASDATLKPLGSFAETSEAVKYPPTLAGEFVEQELSVIKGK